MIYFLLTLTAFGQSNTPAFQWQGVIRDASGTLFNNHTIQLKFSILKGSSTATGAEYTEIHSNIQTNAYGIAHVKVGRGTADTNLPATNLGEINWSTDVYFIKVELDTGLGTFMEMGATEILLPPFSYNHSFIIENDSLKITDTNGTLSVSISELQQRTDSLKLVNNTLRLVASDTTYNVDLTYLNKITVFDFDTSTNVLRIIEANDTLLVDLGKLNTTTVNTIVATESLTVGEVDTTSTDDAQQSTNDAITPSITTERTQTFTVENTGKLSKINLTISSNNGCNIKILNADGSSTGTFYNINQNGNTPTLQTIVFPTPLDVLATEQYILEINPFVEMKLAYGNNNPYTDGVSDLSVGTDPDLVFEVFVDVVSPSPIQSNADGTVLKAPVEIRNDDNELIARFNDDGFDMREDRTWYSSKDIDLVETGNVIGAYEWSFDFPDGDGNDRWSIHDPVHGSILTVRNDGNVGIGIDNPTAKLQIIGTPSGSNGNTLILGYGSSSNLRLGYHNDYSWIQSHGTKPLRINELGNNTILNLNSGKVGIGNPNPVNLLDILVSNSSTNSIEGIHTQWDTDFLFIGLKDEGSDRKDALIRWGDGSPDKLRFMFHLHQSQDQDILILHSSGNANLTGNLTQSSDIRYKTNIKAIPNALEKTLQLSGVNYIWEREKFPNKAFSKEKQIGVIAQTVEKWFPELVHTDEDGYKSVAYSKFTPILIEAIKEQQIQIEDLKTEVNDLQTLLQKNADLAQKLDTLTKQVQALNQNKNASTVSKQ